MQLDLTLLTEILGWTSILLYISLTIFNSMKLTRYAAFASAANDIAWSYLMNWYPKIILNISVAGVNAYRYAKDFTKLPILLINTIAAFVIMGVLYILHFAITTFLENPTIFVALQFVDLGLILLALYMTSLRNYRIIMFLSGFVGFFAYYGNTQMMIIKIMVIGIMIYKFMTSEKEKKIKN